MMKAVCIFLPYKRSFVIPAIVDLDNSDLNEKSCIDLSNIPTESKCKARAIKKCDMENSDYVKLCIKQ